MVWIIGVGDSDTKVERSIISFKKRPIRHFTITVSSRTQRGLERTSAAVRRKPHSVPANVSCISGGHTTMHTVKAFYSALETFEW